MKSRQRFNTDTCHIGAAPSIADGNITMSSSSFRFRRRSRINTNTPSPTGTLLYQVGGVKWLVSDLEPPPLQDATTESRHQPPPPTARRPGG